MASATGNGSSPAGWLWFVGALLVYAATRLVSLEAFPIFSFCDEAIHSVCARDLIAHGFRSPDGEGLPTFFRNFLKYNFSLSVYVQGASNWLLGETVWGVRATTALLSVTSAAALGWLLKTVFRLREWWLGAMLLAVTPVWLVHSRTGFETGLMVICYTWFLLFYCLYRARDPRLDLPGDGGGSRDVLRLRQWGRRHGCLGRFAVDVRRALPLAMPGVGRGRVGLGRRVVPALPAVLAQSPGLPHRAPARPG